MCPSPEDSSAPSAGPHALCCHGCKGGEGDAASAGNARVELWLPSGNEAVLILHTALTSCTPTVKGTAPLFPLRSDCPRSLLAPKEYRPRLPFLWLGRCWQTYSLLSCPYALRRRCNRSSYPLSMFCWRRHRSHCPLPHLLHGPVSSALLCCSSSQWFTVLLHKLRVGISQCLNTEKPHYSLMSLGPCRKAVAEAVLVDLLWGNKHIIWRLSPSPQIPPQFPPISPSKPVLCRLDLTD